jgi:hypothetical protein
MPVFLRGPSIASRVFDWNRPGQIVRSTPRAKFIFKAEFNLTPAARDMMQNPRLNDIGENTGIAFKVKQIDRPKVGLNVVDLNQYNKKKIAYTKIDYNEAQLRIHDTVDNSILNVWVNYFTYFFGDSRTKVSENYNQSTVTPFYQDNTGWGFRPISENVNFFTDITVYAFFAGTYTSFSYINPKITSIDWQNYDYSSTDLEEVSINFKYEAIQYTKFGQPYNNQAGPNDGFIPQDYVVTNDPPAALPQFVQPRLFINQQATFSQPAQNSSVTNPAATLESAVTNNTSVAPGASIPNELITSAALTSTTTPGSSDGTVMQFGPTPPPSVVSSNGPDITAH